MDGRLYLILGMIRILINVTPLLRWHLTISRWRILISTAQRKNKATNENFPVYFLNNIKSIPMEISESLNYLRSQLDPRLYFRKVALDPVLHAGIQRSGTNWLRVILETGFGVNLINSKNPNSKINPKHKHFRVQDNKDSIIMKPAFVNDIKLKSFDDYKKIIGKKNAKAFIIYKDPVNWIQSIKRWALKWGWVENEEQFGYLIKDYLFEWDSYHTKWSEFSLKSPNQVIMLQYEKCVSSNEGYERISNFLGVSPLHTMHPQKVSQSSKRKIDDVISVKEKSINNGFSKYIYDSVSFKPEWLVYD
ncbi:hypothetical protein [Thiohalorhabdus methylotrophus]|uniref:Sulfotransferase domain-containing protein n=1 Tax=Thiohalorhabdus methylotrophus TaxID=3242694 RepID=A0ABV4TYD0_9GAMM